MRDRPIRDMPLAYQNAYKRAWRNQRDFEQLVREHTALADKMKQKRELIMAAYDDMEKER